MKGKHKEVWGGGVERAEGGDVGGGGDTGDVVCCGPIKPQDVTVVDRGR